MPACALLHNLLCLTVIPALRSLFPVYTRDTVILEINSLMYYRISDVRKAIYEVDDLQNALTAAAQTQLKEVFGLMNFHEALECQVRPASLLLVLVIAVFPYVHERLHCTCASYAVRRSSLMSISWLNSPLFLRSGAWRCTGWRCSGTTRVFVYQL